MRTRDAGRSGSLEVASRVGGVSRNALLRAATVMLGGSFVILMAAPAFMPPSYSWIVHTISESGAQGTDGRWFIAGGVLLSAGASWILTIAAGDLWPASARTAFRLYSLGLVASALLAEAPWEALPHNEIEAFLHTVFTFSAGVGFTLGALLVSRARREPPVAQTVLDGLMIAAMLLIPILMLAWLDYDGLLQRFWVLLGFTWWFVEIAHLRRAGTAYWL